MKGKKFKLPCRNRKKGKVEDDPPSKVLTPAMLQVRRQERLAELQAEHSHLEQQLAERDCDNNVFLEEKGTRLTSRASDSDLEYLNNESPPLKRNSISLQDLPQSVIRLRREKELRTLKTEIEYLKKVSEISSRRSQSTGMVLFMTLAFMAHTLAIIIDMGLYDCDGRTALHLAACEGQYEVAEYLLRICGVNHRRRDRFGNTPYDDAVLFNQPRIAELLRTWSPNQRLYSTIQCKEPSPEPNES